MALKKGGLHFGYHDHYAVDGGKARIILEVLVTPADVMENLPCLDMLWRACFRWQLRPDQVTGDATYGTVATIVAVEDQGIRAYVPLSDVGKRPGFFGPEAFSYDAEQDVYTCPNGAVLRFRGNHYAARARAYQAPASACGACPLKARCTDSRKGRIFTRSFDEAYLDRVRGYHETDAYRKAMRKRSVWVEPLFGEAKDWHGLQAVPASRALEGERRGAADRDRPEPEAAAPEARLGTPTVAKRGSGGASGAPTTAAAAHMVAFTRLRIACMRDQSSHIRRSWPIRAAAFFNGLGRPYSVTYVRFELPCRPGVGGADMVVGQAVDPWRGIGRWVGCGSGPARSDRPPLRAVGGA